MPDIKEIAEMVKKQEDSPAWQVLDKLMDEAYAIWSLEPYLSREGATALAGLQHYTSNDPRTFADMVVALLSEATLIPSIPVTDQKGEERDTDSQKERFAIGILKAADERLDNLLLPSLQDAYSWQAAIRGGLAGPWLLGKDEEGKTYVHIMAWDRRFTYWGLGRRGLAWACHKVWKQIADIEADYQVSLDSERTKVEEQGLLVYDWFDEKNNIIGTDEKILKKATPHGSPRVPVAMSFVGHILPIANRNGQLTMRGQDIYHSLRETYKYANFLGGADLTRTAWGVNPNMKHFSTMGDKVLEENPLIGTGMDIPLAKDEDIKPFEVPPAAPEAQAVSVRVNMERQRGGITDVATGMAPYPMAGVAIDRLRAPVNMVISPCGKAIVAVYRQGIQLICDQYATGAFESFEVSGRGRDRKYFRQAITPEIVREGGEIEVEIRPDLPQDVASGVAMYTALRQLDANGVPGISQRTGMERYLKIPDVDLELAAIKDEMTSRYSPWAQYLELAEAAEKQGNLEKMHIYLAQVQIEQAKVLLQLRQAGIETSGGGRNGGGGGEKAQPLNKGFSPTVLHGAAVDNPPAYNPAEGPQVPAGTPRPGAMTEAERLMGEMGR